MYCDICNSEEHTTKEHELAKLLIEEWKSEKKGTIQKVIRMQQSKDFGDTCAGMSILDSTSLLHPHHINSFSTINTCELSKKRLSLTTVLNKVVNVYGTKQPFLRNYKLLDVEK